MPLLHPSLNASNGLMLSNYFPLIVLFCYPKSIWLALATETRYPFCFKLLMIQQIMQGFSGNGSSKSYSFLVSGLDFTIG